MNLLERILNREYVCRSPGPDKPLRCTLTGLSSDPGTPYEVMAHIIWNDRSAAGVRGSQAVVPLRWLHEIAEPTTQELAT